MNVADNAQLRHVNWRLKMRPLSLLNNDLLPLATNASAFSHSFLLGAAVLRHHSGSQLNIR